MRWKALVLLDDGWATFVELLYSVEEVCQTAMLLLLDGHSSHLKGLPPLVLRNGNK